MLESLVIIFQQNEYTFDFIISRSYLDTHKFIYMKIKYLSNVGALSILPDNKWVIVGHIREMQQLSTYRLRLSCATPPSVFTFHQIT